MSQGKERGGSERGPGLEAELFDEALSFALEQHHGGFRKGTRVPYVTHPVIVAETLAYHYPERLELQLAGLLHDVVEDTPATLADVEERFGGRVAELVAAVTKLDDGAPGLPEGRVERWRAQRRGMLAALGADRDVLRLKAADALANLRTVARDLENPDVGAAVWDRFKVGRDESLWYYRAVLERLAPIAEEALAVEYRRELERVARLSGAASR